MEIKNFGELYSALTAVVPGGQFEDNGFGGIVFHTGLKEDEAGGLYIAEEDGDDEEGLPDEDLDRRVAEYMQLSSDMDWDGVSNPGEDSVHYDTWLANEEFEALRRTDSEDSALEGFSFDADSHDWR